MESTDLTLQQLMFSLIEIWKGSGKTQRELCEQKEIAYSKFQYWLRKYNEDRAGGNESPGFVAIPVRKQAEVRAGFLELVYPDGVKRLIFHQDVDPSFLRALLS